MEIALYVLDVLHLLFLLKGPERRLDVFLDLGSEEVMGHGGGLGGVDDLVPLCLEGAGEWHGDISFVPTPSNG